MAIRDKQRDAGIPTEAEVNIGYGEEEGAQLSPEEAQSKIAIMLAESKHLETMSETTDAEVKLIGALSTIGERFELGMLNGYLKHYLQLKVSLHRQGRKEIQEVARPSPQREEQTKNSLRNMLLGGRM
jgi:hypothetical protein